MQQQEAAERQVHRLGQGQVLAGLGQRNDLCVRGGGPCHLVAGERVAVDRVDATVLTDHFGQGHRDVAPTRSDVDTAPARTEPEALQRRGQRAAVDVVAQSLELTHGEAL